ncbi:pre-mRNA-splicing factor 38B-like isoform X1 [Pecten maximus]|uniref:pre-mRNA-splicing factor 38B-like isoform X1 n=1 Tax=Pecten maximus TaxID=6579 RepID=UPI0014589DFA|nr:pre-mRNA-splicing factor 38B-like isoform X1 [Pecten maximus]
MRNGLKGAIAHGYIYVLIAICLAVLPQPASTSVTLVDYEKNDCTKSFQVNDINVYQVQSYPRQGVNTGRDRCYNQFVGFNNKKLKIHVYEVKIGSCGIFLNIFDGDEKMLNDPRWVLGCRGAEKTVYESYTSEVIVRLDKPSSDSSSLYSFRIYITNEDGPAVDLSDPPSMSDGGASSGVLVGVGIGVGLVVVVIVIVVAIVCWRMMNKKEKYANKNPAVFTTSTTRGGDSVHFENTLGGSRSRNIRAPSERSSTTNGYRSTSGSQRGRSSQHQDNNGYVSSNDSSVTTKKVSYNPIPIKAGDGAKFESEKEITTHRFKKRDGSVRKQINSDHEKEIKKNPKKERPLDDADGAARVELIQKSKINDNSHSLARSSSEKRNTKLRSNTISRAETSSDTMSSLSDRRSKRDDGYRERSQDDGHRNRSRDDRYDERPKDSTSRRSSYRESQSQDRRDRTSSIRSRTNSTSRSARPGYKDDHDGGQRHRSGHDYRDKRHQEQYYSDYDSDHRNRRREKHDRNRGYDSDARRRHHDYDSDRGGGRDRSRHRTDQSDRYYSDYESDHGRRRDSSRRRRPDKDRNYRDYDSDDNSYRSNRRRSQRQDHRDKYYSDEDLVDSRRRRTGSLSRKSRPRSQSYSRDSRR